MSGRDAARALVIAAALSLIGASLVHHPFYGSETLGMGGIRKLMLAGGVLLAAIASIPRPRLWMGVSVMLVTTAFLFTALELLAERALGSFIRAPYEADATRLFKLHPGAESWTRLDPDNGGHLVFHRVNQDGFRGPELRTPAPPRRVMVFGDSFVHAIYAADGDTFVEKLGAGLEAHFGPTETVNAGVSSYGPDQVAVWLPAALETFRPQLVVLAVFAGNDYGDLMRNKIYRIGDDGDLSSNPYQLDPTLARGFELNRRSSALLSALRRLKRSASRSAAVPIPDDAADPRRAWVDAVVEIAHEEYEDHVVRKNPIVTNVYIDHYSADLSTDPQSPSGRYKAQLMQLVLHRIFEACKLEEIPVVLVAIPHVMDLTNEYAIAEVDRTKYPRYHPRNLIDPLIEAARTSSVAAVDLFEVFRSWPNGRTRDLYLNGADDHWNPTGQAVAAEAVRDTIVKNDLLSRDRR